jgi:hypothetical protein
LVLFRFTNIRENFLPVLVSQPTSVFTNPRGIEMAGLEI